MDPPRACPPYLHVASIQYYIVPLFTTCQHCAPLASGNELRPFRKCAPAPLGLQLLPQRHLVTHASRNDGFLVVVHPSPLPLPLLPQRPLAAPSGPYTRAPAAFPLPLITASTSVSAAGARCASNRPCRPSRTRAPGHPGPGAAGPRIVRLASPAIHSPSNCPTFPGSPTPRQ